VKNILCDLGGVLLEVDFDRAINKLSRECRINKQELFIRIFKTGLKNKHDLGEIEPLAFYNKIVPSQSISFSRFKYIWSDIFTEKIEVIKYIISLQKYHSLFIASNTDPIHYEHFRNTYPWLNSFNGLGLSYNLGIVKPSKKFFVKLCRKFNIDYKNAIFIDDLNANVKSANALGINSHLFKCTAHLKQFIERELNLSIN